MKCHGFLLALMAFWDTTRFPRSQVGARTFQHGSLKKISFSVQRQEVQANTKGVVDSLFTPQRNCTSKNSNQMFFASIRFGGPLVVARLDGEVFCRAQTTCFVTVCPLQAKQKNAYLRLINKSTSSVVPAVALSQFFFQYFPLLTILITRQMTIFP